MDYGHYTTRTVEEAVQLCNALANRAEPPGPDELRAMLGRLDLGPGDLDVEGLTHLAARLRRVFTTDQLADRVAILNDLITLYQPHPSIVDHDGQGYHLHYHPPGAGHLRTIGASMVMALGTVLCDFGESRLGVCPQCADVFVDTTRNGSQRFCSRTCANRVHAASHRARAAGAAG
jgi:predicted RNA-binding Zn ribbon-like protein